MSSGVAPQKAKKTPKNKFFEFFPSVSVKTLLRAGKDLNFGSFPPLTLGVKLGRFWIKPIFWRFLGVGGRPPPPPGHWHALLCWAENHRKSRKVPENVLYTGRRIMRKVKKLPQVCSILDGESHKMTKNVQKMSKNTIIMLMLHDFSKNTIFGVPCRGRKKSKNPGNREFLGSRRKFCRTELYYSIDHSSHF